MMTESTPIRVDNRNGPGIREIARTKVELLAEKSEIFDPVTEHLFPRFNESEVQIGKELGIGGFSTVFEIRRVKLDANQLCHDSTARYGSEERDRSSISKNLLYKNGESKFALKQLSEETWNDAHHYLKGVLDLAIELKYLSVMDHPHIITLRGVSDRDAFEDRGFFLVLDRLYDTLERRCCIWRREKNGFNALMAKVGVGKRREGLLLDRLGVALDICSALLYMHKRSIIYRDLKPENIGFDVQDNVKVFDLGLAREVHLADMQEDGTWKLTGMTGSLRYMAPEVVSWSPYNFSADVYSYGILLWQIMSLKFPFDGMTVRTHYELVVQRGERPAVKKSWPSSWESLLNQCWHADLRRRSRLQDIANMIQSEIVRIRGDPDDLHSNRRRMSLTGRRLSMTEKSERRLSITESTGKRLSITETTGMRDATTSRKNDGAIKSIGDRTNGPNFTDDTVGDDSVSICRTEEVVALNRTMRADSFNRVVR